MPTFYGAIDLVKNELRNAVIQNLGSAPGTPSKGQMYMNSSDNTLYWYDGAQWIAAKAAAGATPAGTVTTQAVGDAGVVGVSTNFAREDHKHGREAFGAVTAQTTFGAASSNGAAVTLPRSDHVHGTPVHDNAAHSAITLNSLAVPTTQVSMNGQLLRNMADPAVANDAATKNYVDNTVQGLDAKASVKAASTVNVAMGTLTTLDGVTLVDNDRILLKNQTAPAENGIYTVTLSPPMTIQGRASDMNLWVEVPSAYVWVEQGTTQADTGWVCTADAGGTLGTTAITWTQFSGAGQITAGTGLTKTGNSIDVIAGDTSLTVAADDVRVNTAVIATVASLASYVPTTRQVIAGTGLTGGGALSADATLNVIAGNGIVVAADSVAVQAADTSINVTAGGIQVNSAVIPLSSTTMTAGNGLTGGGTLAANRTFDVGAGTGITVAADTVAVDSSVVALKTDISAMAKKFAAALTGTTSPETVTHNLNTRDIQLTVLNGATPYTAVEVDWDATTVNTAVIRYNPNLGAGYRVVVVG